MLDSEIREQFAQWAQPLREAVPPPLGVVRRRARRRTIRSVASAVAAAAAVAVVAGVLVTSREGPLQGPSPVPPPVSGSRFLAGPLLRADAGPASAPFYVTLDQGDGQAAVVQDAAGRTLGQVRPPAGMVETWVADAGDDRTFVLSASHSTGPTRFYEVRLSPAGRPGPLTRLRVPALPGVQVDGMALSADGTQLAVATEAQRTGARPALEVVSLATGRVRSWQSAGQYATMLSFAGDHTVAMQLEVTAPDAVAPLHGSGVRLLDTRAAGGQTPLAASRLVVPNTEAIHGAAGVVAARITPDGSKLYVGLQPEQGRNVWRIAEFSPRTGKLVRVAMSVRSASSGVCDVVWTDSSGRQLRAECGFAQKIIDNGTVRPAGQRWAIPLDDTPDPTSYAW